MRVQIRNTAGLNNNAKLHDTMAEARMDDVIMWQETKLQADKISLLRSKWGQDVFMACFEGASRRGVVTLFADKLEAEHLDVKRDAQGQFLLSIFQLV